MKHREGIENERENLITVFKKMFSITEDAASNEEIRDRILTGGKITGTNMVVMICAILIASVGLNTNSVAVIIGAMLISPLMGSILAISYGTVSNDAYLMKRHSVGFAVQILISVATATIYFLLSPIKEPTEQLLARTNPNFYDVMIAGSRLEYLADQKNELKDLAEYSLITLERHTSSYEFYSQFYLENGLTMRPDIEVATADLILPMVEKNLGIGFLPYELAEQALEEGRVFEIPLKESIPERRICMLYDTKREIGAAGRRFREMVVTRA